MKTLAFIIGILPALAIAQSPYSELLMKFRAARISPNIEEFPTFAGSPQSMPCVAVTRDDPDTFRKVRIGTLPTATSGGPLFSSAFNKLVPPFAPADIDKANQSTHLTTERKSYGVITRYEEKNHDVSATFRSDGSFIYFAGTTGSLHAVQNNSQHITLSMWDEEDFIGYCYPPSN